MRSRARFRLIVAAAMTTALALAVIVAGCGDGEDRPGVDVIEDGGTGTGSGTGTGTGTGTGIGVEPGVVESKPDDAIQVDVMLSEWAIELSQQTVPAGKIYFLAENVGPDDPHEVAVVRSDAEPDALPTEEGRVPEDEIELIGEIHPFAVGTLGSMVLDLEPGNYVLICNIAEMEQGELESHYELGMTTRLVVE